MGLVRAIIICSVLALSTGNPQGPGSSTEVWLVKKAGNKVQFNTSRVPAPYTNLSWTYSGGLLPIITVEDGDSFPSPTYEDRITLFNDGSLELRHLTTRDTGEYTVNITTTGGPDFNSRFLLKVQDPVSNVSLYGSPPDLAENDFLTLICSAFGSDLRYSWFNNSRPMEDFPTSQSGYIRLSVKRFDTGPFRCNAYNLINTVSSEEVNVTVSYGPDVDLKAVPSENAYPEGSSVTLVCTVDSKPEAEISWYWDELLLSNGTEFVLEDLTSEKRGDYCCRANNRKTGQIVRRCKYITVEYDIASVWKIFGIVMACVVVAVGFSSVLTYLYKRKKNRSGAD